MNLGDLISFIEKPVATVSSFLNNGRGAGK